MGVGLTVLLAGAAAGYGGDRRRPVTGAAGRGSSARLVGFRPKGVTKAAAPPTARRPGLTPAAYGGHPGRSFPLNCSRPPLAGHGLGRQARRAEGAPLKP